MTDQEKEIRTAVVAALSDYSDEMFSAVGFMRRPDGLRYERKVDGCTQHVDVCIEHTPRDDPNAAAAVYPWLSVKIAAIDTVAVQMTDGNERLLSLTAPTLHQPIELVAPKGVGARWFIYQSDSVGAAIREFAGFSQQWLFPFLAEYVNPANVVAMFESRDERVLHDQDQFLRVVAAMVHLGNVAAARETLEAKFGRPGNRRRFAPVFEYFSVR